MMIAILGACHRDPVVQLPKEVVMEPHSVFSKDFLSRWETSSLQCVSTQGLEINKYVSSRDTTAFMEDVEDRRLVIEALTTPVELRSGFTEYLIENQDKLYDVKGEVYLIETFDMRYACDPYVYEVYLIFQSDSICGAHKFAMIGNKWKCLSDLTCSDVKFPSYFSGLEFKYHYKQYSDPIIYSRITEEGEITSKVLNNYGGVLREEVDKLWGGTKARVD